MADTSLNTNLRVQKWDSDFFVEYVRDTPFSPYMGAEEDMMPIFTKRELTSGGKSLTMGLVGRLKGRGVQGKTKLTGAEEALSTYDMSLTVNWNRNAVVVTKPDEHWTPADLRAKARKQLKSWASESLRDDIIAAGMATSSTITYLMGKSADAETDVPLTPAEAYAAQSEASKDAWLAANADRYLFGAAVSNNNANDHSASLLNIDTSADRLSASTLSLAKLIARTAGGSTGQRIRPFKADSQAGREWFVLFVNSYGFRDLKRDTSIAQANRDARPRDTSSNPIFQDGDLIWDGVIIREVPEMPTITGVGASTSDVACAFLCGVQSIALAWGQEPVSRIGKEDDYGFRYPVGIEECRGVKKAVFNGVQHGMVSVWHSSPATV